MISAEAINKIEELTLEGAGKLVEIDGVTYATRALHDVRKAHPRPAAIEVSTLESFVEYLRADIDELQGAKDAEVLIHVESPTQVRVLSRLQGHFALRSEYIVAKHNPAGFPTDSYLSQEDMCIALRARCADTDDRARALSIIGNLKDEAFAISADDGITQKATVKSGIHVVDEIPITNPFLLAPFRTFTEVEQPESPFILRLKKSERGPAVAFFEADGGAWKLKATAAVAAWLRENLAELSITILH